MDKDTELALKVGQTYEAKRPSRNMRGLVNDRMIIWIGIGTLQYDSPTVRNGARHPMVTHAEFRRWAGRDVTSEMPNGEWRASVASSVRAGA